jgi:hypothetical protein
MGELHMKKNWVASSDTTYHMRTKMIKRRNYIGMTGAASVVAVFIALTVWAQKPVSFAGNVRPDYELLPVVAVKPNGWMLAQLEADLAEGITGHLGDFCSNVSSELFAKQERTPGTRVTGSRGIPEKAWWAGEHEGYWYDGLTRAAILVGSEKDIGRVRAWVEAILKRHAETGYIGIYSPEARLPAQGFDGELWTQSRAMEALLAWYEFSGDQRVLDAVAGTVRMTIDHYREKGTYFLRPGIDGGVTHGVGYMDTLEWLWRLTRDPFFADAAIWLYQDYNRYRRPDLLVNNMLDMDKLWYDHGPHTAESLHMPGIAGFFSGDERFLAASRNVLPKLERHTNPGGGLIAGKLESIAGVLGGGDEANEYCSKTEAMITLGRLFQYDGNLGYGDWIERCALNAAQGARLHTANTATIYLSRDNRLRADGTGLLGGRELFSANHYAAACCVLTSTRLLPTYVANMWYRSTGRPELLANLYGASILETEVGGQPVRIVQETDYPFSDKVRFRMEPKEPVAFALTLRIPINSGTVKVKAVGAEVSKAEKSIRVSKVWKSGDTVEVDFDFQVNRALQHDGMQAFYEWGPLVFALPIQAEITPGRRIMNDGVKTEWYDLFVRPMDDAPWATLDHPDASFVRIALDGDTQHPWARPTVGLKGTLLKMDGTPFEANLVPMGSTSLRRTTFPLTREIALEANEKHKGPSFSPEEDPMRNY